MSCNLNLNRLTGIYLLNNYMIDMGLIRYFKRIILTTNYQVIIYVGMVFCQDQMQNAILLSYTYYHALGVS